MDKPNKLSWQKVRHILNDAGVLDDGWKIGTKKDGENVAVVWFPGDKPPGKRRTAKLVKALAKAGITYNEHDANHFGIPQV